MRKFVTISIVVVAVFLVGAQFLPTIAGKNPPETAPIELTAEVEAVLDQSCFDCHSHRTRWPWYSRVAPTGWFVTHHVEEGRKHLNFSTWGDLSAEDRAEALEEIWEEVEEGNMPLRSYLWLHRDARLTAKDMEILESWLRG